MSRVFPRRRVRGWPPAKSRSRRPSGPLCNGPLADPDNTCQFPRGDGHAAAAEVVEMLRHEDGAPRKFLSHILNELGALVVEERREASPLAVALSVIYVVAALFCARSIWFRLLALEPAIMEIRIHAQNLGNAHRIHEAI